MEQLNPTPLMAQPPRGMPMMMPGAPFAQGLPLQRPGAMTAGPFMSEQEQKKKEFARGIFVSGFEKTVTTAMLQNHFSIKPISGIRNPTTKHRESKGFAFIYYGSEDDALHVKKTLDRTAILKSKIRVTRTVISENLSKMMFKLKTAGLEQKTIKENETSYFNDQNLEKEAQRIIRPIFQNTVEVNKITIPHSKKDMTPLRYARVQFYVSDIKEASNIATRGLNTQSVTPVQGKNQYEKILTYINELVNKDATFSRYVRSQIYEYTKKNQSNVLHIKGIDHKAKEDPAALAEELKEFTQSINPQWNIVNVYAAPYQEMGAWANITFSTYEETKQAYEHFKANKSKFRNKPVYGSLRNVKDPRTVVVSVVKKEVREKDVEKFLNQLAAESVKRKNEEGATTGRKYDYFSFNIIESKRFYRTDRNETQGVIGDEVDKVDPSWMEINEVPRRLVIHFHEEFNDDSLKELTTDIKNTRGFDDIFMASQGDPKKQLRSNLQKGHVNKDGTYTKHTELRAKPRKTKTNLGPGMRPKQGGLGGRFNKGGMPTNLAQFSLTGKGGMPKVSNPGAYMRGGIPQIGMSGPGIGSMPIGIPGSVPGPLPGMNPPPGYMGGAIPGRPQQPPGGPGFMGMPSGQPLPGSQPPMIGQPAPGFKPPFPAAGFGGIPMPGMPGMPIPGMAPPPFGAPKISGPPGFGPPKMNAPPGMPFGIPKPPQGPPPGQQ